MIRTLLFITILLPVFVKAADWFPIEKAELERSKPKINPDAPAEVIFWHVYIEDKMQGDEPQHIRRSYIRIKIYNEKGREKYVAIVVERGRAIAEADEVGELFFACGIFVFHRRRLALHRQVFNLAVAQDKDATAIAADAREPGNLAAFVEARRIVML